MSVKVNKHCLWMVLNIVLITGIWTLATGITIENPNAANANIITTSPTVPAAEPTTVKPMQNGNDNGLVDVTVSQRHAETNSETCPNMLHYIFEGAIPRDGYNAGTIEIDSILEDESIAGDDSDLRACVNACCEKGRNGTCNVVFVYKQKCYHVRCESNEACLPKERPHVKHRLQMILVNPVKRDDATDENNISWVDVIKAAKTEKDLYTLDDVIAGSQANRLSFWKKPHKWHLPTQNQQNNLLYDDEEFPVAEKRVGQLLMSPIEDSSSALSPEDIPFYGSNLRGEPATAINKYVQCDYEISEMGNHCPPKEECVALHSNAQTGICKCMRGYVRNALRECVPQFGSDLDYPFAEDSLHRPILAASASDVLPVAAQQQLPEDSTVAVTAVPLKDDPEKKIVVSVLSKEVRLPEKEVTLAAYTIPEEKENESKYKYLWTLVTQPKGPMNGTISDQSKSKVKLSNLSEGLYTFKVTVTGDNGTYGEAMANVTVLPAKRINRIPQAVITPKTQIIRQPITNAVLEGSLSSDDDKIIAWHWEVVSGPIGYQPKLPDTSILQLSDLTSPGNYTFKLTVTDSDNMTNSTTATISVLKEIDYPPVANAGTAVILYLPTNNVTLNGTASSDDHEIVAWEWTKDANDEAKAVDMQNTRTPYLQLSNLEEGMYTFVLKVTDASGQSNTDKVHVFVKPPTNSPPKAVASANVTINLPLNWALLNGSQSTDDIKISSYSWKQLTGPNKANLLNSNASIANATALTLGLYEFELTVTDESNNTASDQTWVKVVQEKNAPPVAHAGGDKSVTLPVSALYLNGTASSDDLAVVKYRWTREDNSLAAGIIVGNSDEQPVLILTNLVHGNYAFRLTVSDEQGLTSSDVANIMVHPDPLLMSLVELTLPMQISDLTKSEADIIVQKVGLVLGELKVHVRELKYDTKTEASILVFYAELPGKDGKTRAVDGLTIERLLKDKLQRDESIFGDVFVDVRTTICQYNCSGHGVCNEQKRSCMCESFWMPSISYYWGFDEANCDWSILYVFVGIIVIFLLLSGMFWGINCTSKRQPKKQKKYSLIRDEEAPQFRRANSLSDSETDSDVLFETRTKPNGILRQNGAPKSKHNHGHSRYATSRMGRKVKT